MNPMGDVGQVEIKRKARRLVCHALGQPRSSLPSA